MIFYGAGHEFSLLQDALTAGGMAWWLMELPTKSIYFSPNKIVMLGFDKNEADKFVKYTDFTERLHPDDYENTMQAMRDHMNGTKPIYETSYRIRRKDNTYTSFFDRGKIIGRNKNGDIGIAGIVMEISDATKKIVPTSTFDSLMPR